MNAEKSSVFYKDEIESINGNKDFINKNESINVVFTQENDIVLEETDKKQRLMTVIMADIKWTINSEGKISYINPYTEDCIGNDAKYLIKKIVSRYLTKSSVMACLIELEDLLEMLRTSKNTHQRKLIVDLLKNESEIEKLEVTSSAIFDTKGNIVGIQGLCNFMI